MRKQNMVLYFIFGFFLISMFIIAWQNYKVIDNIKDSERDSYIDNANLELKYLKSNIRSELSYFGKSIFALSGMSSLKNYISNNSRIADVEKDFISYLRSSEAFYQLRYIGNDGYEKIRIDKINDEYKIYDSSSLQYKGSRYYFTDAMMLEFGEIYISNMDLNVEYDEIENRGTTSNPIYVPIIRFSSPVFNELGERDGVIVLNVYADYFLGEIENVIQNDRVFLVNSEGYYLYNYNKTKTFGFMFNNSETFFRDFKLPEDFFLKNIKYKKIELDNKIFLLDFIYPDFEIYESYIGSKKVSEENRFWVLVYVLDN